MEVKRIVATFDRRKLFSMMIQRFAGKAIVVHDF